MQLLIWRTSPTQNFAEVAEGLRLIADNMLRIDSDAQTLVELEKPRGARILAAFAAFKKNLG